MTHRYIGNLGKWWRERDQAIVDQVRDGIPVAIIADGAKLTASHIQAILKARGWKYDRGRKAWVRG